jgi:hypothetical protein
MQQNRALLSGWTAMTDQMLRSDHLKLCFLWYDEILVEPIGEYDESTFIGGLLRAEENERSIAHAMTDVIRPLDRQLQQAIAGDLLTQASRGYPRWGKDFENYTYPEPQTPAEFAHNRMLELIAQEHGVSGFEDGYDIEQAEGRARVAVDAVALWEGVNAELPCMLQAGADERAAMIAARQFTTGPTLDDAPLRLLEMAVPSLCGVSWKDVVRFRSSDALRALRQKLADSVDESEGDVERAKILLQQSEQETLDAMLEVSRPRVKRVAFEAILGNVPGLAVNPFSLYFGARDTVKHYKRQRDSGWFYLLRDIRTTAGPIAGGSADA